jgi:Zn-dependent protease with chaperone function
MPWVVLAWAIGVLLSLSRLAGGWFWLQRLRWSRAELAPDGLQRQLLDLCRRAGLKRAVTLLMCERLPGPSVVGILRPAILVPAGWFLNLPPDHVEALLAHELAHVLRHDYAVNLLQSLLEVVLFYHPGVWWLSRRIRAERELACDTFAVRLMGDALPLAEALTDLERRGLRRASFEPAPAAHGGSLMERISHLLLPPRRTSSAPAFGAMAVMAALLATGLYSQARTTAPRTASQNKATQDSATPGTVIVRPKWIVLPSGAKVGNENAAIYIHSRNAKDPRGKDLPHTQLLDIKADEVPLNQIWKLVEDVINTRDANTGSDTWDSRRQEFGGPNISLDLTGASPEDVLATLNKLAKQLQVAPYQGVASNAPEFRFSKHKGPDGQTSFDLVARKVSSGFLEKMLNAAKFMASDDSKSGFMVGPDTSSGPKVDVNFEGLSLKELEERIHNLQAEMERNPKQ